MADSRPNISTHAPAAATGLPANMETNLDFALGLANAGYMAANNLDEEHDREALRAVFHSIGEYVKGMRRLCGLDASEGGR